VTKAKQIRHRWLSIAAFSASSSPFVDEIDHECPQLIKFVNQSVTNLAFWFGTERYELEWMVNHEQMMVEGFRLTLQST